jgi:hypothetical protein
MPVLKGEKMEVIDIDDERRWTVVFLILSIKRCRPYLKTLDFPLLSDIEEITLAARQFTEKYYTTIRPIHVNDFRLAELDNLLNSTIDGLRAKVGDNVDQLRPWARQFSISTPFEKSVLLSWSILDAYLDRDKVPPLNLSGNQLEVLHSIVIEYRARNRDAHNAFKVIEELPQDEWDVKVTHWYNGIDLEEPLEPNAISPLDRLYQLLMFLRIRSCFTELTIRLNEESLHTLNTWVEEISKGRKLESLDLIEIIDNL